MTACHQDFRPAWEEFASYADLSMSNDPLAGETCMRIERHFADSDWTIQHSKCSREKSILHTAEDGNHVCQKCFDNCNDQRLLRPETAVEEMFSFKLPKYHQHHHRVPKMNKHDKCVDCLRL